MRFAVRGFRQPAECRLQTELDASIVVVMMLAALAVGFADAGMVVVLAGV